MKKRILLAEDHKDTLELLEHELDFLGYEIAIAKNGLEAVDLAGSEKPDLIIMDIMLPTMNGFEAIAKIRSSPKHDSSPFLLQRQRPCLETASYA